jgi:hypothetical protein
LQTSKQVIAGQISSASSPRGLQLFFGLVTASLGSLKGDIQFQNSLGKELHQSCIVMLNELGKQLQACKNPLYHILQTTLNLHELVLEDFLFDTTVSNGKSFC